MTRETKVGLLVGMGMILFIGILVSDFLSKENRSMVPDFTNTAAEAQKGLLPGDVGELPKAYQTDSTANNGSGTFGGSGNGSGDRNFNTTPGRLTPLPMPEDFSPRPRPVEPARVNPRDTVNPPAALALDNNGSMMGSPSVGSSALPPLPNGAHGSVVRTLNSSGSASAVPMVHQVAKGESLYDIAVRYYGDGDKWRAIAQANPKAFDNTGRLATGVKLQIPSRSDVASSITPIAPPTTVAVNSNAPSGKTIKVAAGDTLASLASKHLGTRSRWTELLDANKDKLKKAEDLKLGMELRLPADKKSDNKPEKSVKPAVATPSTGSTGSPALATAGGAGAGSSQASDASNDSPSKTYLVQPGDTLSSIARKVYSDQSKYDVIFKANRDQLQAEDDLAPGQKLTIPAIASR